MGKFTILVFALLTVVGYGWITAYPNAREVEVGLQTAVDAALKRPGMEWASARMDGQTAILTGVAPTPAAQDKALSLVQTAAGTGGPLWGGVVVVDDRTSLASTPPPPSQAPRKAERSQPRPVEPEKPAVVAVKTPYVWRVSFSGSAAMLAGAVPNETVRSALMQQARQLFAVVDDTMVVTPDAPAGDWQAAAQLALAQITQLERGTAELTDLRLSIQGDAMSAGAAAAVEAALKGLPPGYQGKQQLSVKQAAIVPPVQPLQQPVQMPVQQPAQLPVPQPVPQPVQQPVPQPVQQPVPQPVQLPKPREESPPPPVVEAMAKAPVPKPGAVAAECQQQITSAMGKATIRFAMQSAEIEKASFSQLDQVVKVLKRCGDVRVLIGGHTDAKGREEYNRNLSLERARSVRDYFASAGVPRERIQVAGHGSSRPIATNETEDGRNRNRRITFEVSEP